MSDLDRFIELYRSFGIECVVNAKGENKVIYLCESDYTFDEQATLSDKLKGYNDFFSKVIFDGNGKFIEQGFYE
jgi:hypothetical protein